MSAERDVDMINHPPHYTKNGIECIDALEAMVSTWPAETGYRLGNVLKYLWRHRDKGSPVESLKKAEFYLKREISKLEGRPEPTPEQEDLVDAASFLARVGPPGGGVGGKVRNY